MAKAFVIVNSQHQVLAKSGEWIAPTKLKQAFYTDAYDVALNELIERNQKHIEERLSVVACTVDERGRPIALVEAGDLSEC